MGRMFVQNESNTRETLQKVVERHKGFDFESFTAATVYTGSMENNGYANISRAPDGRYICTLLVRDGQDTAGIARMAVASETCAALAASSAEMASFVNRAVRTPAHAAFAWLDAEKGALDICLLGAARLIRYNPHNQMLQGYKQDQNTLGSMEPPAFDNSLGSFGLEISKGEKLLFVYGDVDWEDLVRKVLKRAETDAEKQQCLFSMLANTGTDAPSSAESKQHDAIVLMLSV